MIDFNKILYNLLRPVYVLLAWAYDNMIALAENTIFDNVDTFTKSIYLFVSIFMLFRLAISLLNYLINPESFSDKSSGGSKMLSRVIISLIMIVASNFVFGELTKLQTYIVSPKDGIIFRIININNVGTGVSYQALEDPTQCVRTSGSILAADLLKSFFDGEGTDTDEFFTALSNSFSRGDCDNDYNYVNGKIEAKKTIKDDDKVEIHFLTALIACFGVLAFVIIMAIDVVVRNLKLLLLQMISPVAFVSYMNPKDKIFNQWIKNYGSVYADLFLKLIAVSFVIQLIGFVMDSGINGFEVVFYVLGVLVFAKAVPSFISKIFGIDGAGSFKESAGMLKKGLGFAAGAAAGVIGAGFAAHKAGIAGRKAQRQRAEEISKKLKDKNANLSNAERAKLYAQSLANNKLARGASSVGRFAKMASTAGIKGAGAGFQGKGMTTGFAGAITEGDNLATALEEGATLKERTKAKINKTFGTDFGGMSKAKERKEALDNLNKKDSELKSKIKEEMYKKNVAGVAESQMKLDAMEQANKDGHYARVLAELGYEKVGTGESAQYVLGVKDKDGKYIETKDVLTEAEIADKARAMLAKQRTNHAEREKATIQAVINGEFIDHEGNKAVTDILSSTPELQKLGQELEEASMKAKNAGAEVNTITRKTIEVKMADGSIKKVDKLDFGGQDLTVDIEHGKDSASGKEYYAEITVDEKGQESKVFGKMVDKLDENGEVVRDDDGNPVRVLAEMFKSGFKTYSDDVVTKSQEVATEMQQSGAGAARTYVDNQNKK